MAYGVSNGHMTPKGQTCDPNTVTAQYFETAGDAILATVAR